MRRAGAVAAALALLSAACSGKPEPPRAGPEPAAPPRAQYYYDLGPAAVDVSAYPAEIREDYKLFLSVCGTCHTPARPLNSPHADAAVWRRFVRRMHVKMESRGAVLAGADEERITAFLVHDSKVRKLDRKAEFEASQQLLRKRFEETAAAPKP